MQISSHVAAETAHELHREVSRRGLELRRGNGRDDPLLAALAGQLGISPIRFSENLKKANLPAAAYLEAFLRTAAPFARMFGEIWDYVGRIRAPRTNETLRVRFGFENDPKRTDVDLEQFRVYAESAARVADYQNVLLWTDDELRQLFDLRLPFEPLNRDNAAYYQVGLKYSLPEVSGQASIDKIARHVRSALIELIDAAAAAARNAGGGDKWRGAATFHAGTLAHRAMLLTDILPTWFCIFRDWTSHSRDAKREALEYFQTEVEPRLSVHKRMVERPMRQALDLLDLPFWRFRWHTYEVWATVRVLNALCRYGVTPIISAGRIPIDGYESSKIAEVGSPAFAHLYSQSVSGIDSPKRRIKPDLRISKDEPPTNAGTACIIEFKQRKQLDEKHIRDVAAAYAAGCGIKGGVVLINYDDAVALEKLESLPEVCEVITGVRPGCDAELARFERAVRAGLRPLVGASRLAFDCVLLDVSTSMASLYAEPDISRSIKYLIESSGVPVYLFNDHLSPLRPVELVDPITCAGGTDLATALGELRSLVGTAMSLLVVTDGEYPGPVNWDGFEDVRECAPEELPDLLSHYRCLKG